MALPWESVGPVSPYGRLSASSPYARKRALMPPHLATSAMTSTAADLLAGSPGPKQAIRPVESMGLNAIPQKRHVAEPAHRVFTTSDRIAESNMRYFTEVSYPAHHPAAAAAAASKLSSVAVRAALDETAPPPPPNAHHDDARPVRRGRGALDVHHVDHVAALIPLAGTAGRATGETVARSVAPDAVRVDTAAAFGQALGAGVGQALGSTPPVDYGWGRYGLHPSRQSSRGGSSSRAHYVHALGGDAVADLLQVTTPAPPPPVPTGHNAKSGGSKGGSGTSKFTRELRGAGDLISDAPSRIPPARERFATSSGSAHTGDMEGGPRIQPPRRRVLAYAHPGAAANDPYKATSIL